MTDGVCTAGGGAFFVNADVAALEDCMWRNNSAADNGGGTYSFNAPGARFKACEWEGNSADRTRPIVFRSDDIAISGAPVYRNPQLAQGTHLSTPGRLDTDARSEYYCTKLWVQPPSL
eukprot:4171571-Pyramimonas_sp.AAC.2